MIRKYKILLISYAAAGVFVLAGLVFSVAAGNEGYRRSQDNEYRRAMGQLVTAMNDVDTALQQGQYAADSGMTGRVCAKLMAGARSASTALSILPLDTVALEEVAEFLSQLEEYARVKGDLSARGTAFDETDRETAARLRTVTEALTPALQEMYTRLTDGVISIRGRLQQPGLVTAEADTYLEDEILALLHDLPDAPQLLYAGKYADNYDDRYQAVTGSADVSEAKAKETAVLVTGNDSLTADGLSGGALPGYYFSGESEYGGQTVAIAQQGGATVLYLQEYEPGVPAVTEDEAKQAAQAFLDRAGYDSLQEYESIQEGGLLKVRYVYADDLAEYPADAVDVAVALDTGTVVSLNAEQYLHNHKVTAETQPPKLTADEAAEAAVPAGLTVTKSELTWYTGDTGQAILCWKLHCDGEAGQACTIYADANTGAQVEIK